MFCHCFWYWWEGRKSWGKLVNDSRNLATQLDAILPENDKANRMYFNNKIKMFAKVLHVHLTNESTKYMLDENEHPEYDAFLLTQHPPSHIVNRMRKQLSKMSHEGELKMEERLLIENTLNGFIEIAGACERIKNTPIPFAYAFIKKFIFLYVITLPIGYVFTTGYWIVPLAMIVFYVLLSLELIAEEIEDPFNGGVDDLPTAKIAENIGKNVTNILTSNIKMK